MKNLSKVVILMILFFLQSCRSDSQSNPRAYVEGRVVSSAVDYNRFTLQIVSDDVVMAATMLEAGGTFRLSGPLRGDGFKLKSSVKIMSFRTDRAGLQLSADAMEINVPAGITYLKFNEIVLEK